jgi:opacity protein-like surface antigen
MKISTPRFRVTTSLSALICALFTLPAADVAADTAKPSWYATGFLGTSQISDPSSNFKPTQGNETRGKIKLDSGMSNGGSVGMFLGADLRTELEVTYRSNSLKSSSVINIDANQTDADLASLIFTANVLKDFNGFSTNFATFKPYVGVGLGIVQEIDTDIRINGTLTELEATNRGVYQLLTGVNWYYRSGWFAGAGLRWVDAGNVKLKGKTGELKIDYKGLSGDLRIGYRF